MSIHFEDCYGSKHYVKGVIYDVNGISSILFYLGELSKLKNYSAFKLRILLLQFSKFKYLYGEQKEKAKAFFSDAITSSYEKCKQFYPNTFHDNEDLEKLYEEVRSSLFD